MRTIERRLMAAEKAIKPPKPAIVEILVEPLESDVDDAWGLHKEDLVRSVASADRVIVISSLVKDRHPESSKVRYVATEFEAQLMALSLQPSERGNSDALGDLLQALHGNVLSPSNE